MLHIVAIDDLETNNVVIEFDIEDYFDTKPEKYSFKSFTDAKGGLNYSLKTKIDILFLDIMMPVIDGFEVLQKIRDNATYQPFVVVVTALNDEKSRKKAKELGADSFISKPFDITEIHKVLDDYLSLQNRDLNESEEDGFIDFDELFEDEANEAIISLNETHNACSATDFHDDLKKMIDEEGYEDLMREFYMLLEDVSELEDINEDNIKYYIDYYISVMHKLATLMEMLGSEFQELGYHLSLSSYFLNSIEKIEDLEKLKTISTYLTAFLDEVSLWIKSVFIEKNAIDVCYANASFKHSLIQIENLAN